LVKELVWAGFDMVSRANNHAGDYGVLGMDLTTKYVAEAGLVQAGVGHSLPEAREAKFLEHAKGRVALISVASTFPDSSRAGRTRGDMPARPGLNPLRFETITTVTAQRLADLRQIQAEINGSSAAAAGRGGNTEALNFFGRRFVAGPKPGVRTEPDKEDLTEIATVVKNASGLADYTIVTIHCHEGGRDRTLPADFLVTFARAMIDAGADMFVGHGPHVLRGIEIYKGKPILYSLGDFIFQNETLLRLPSENYEGVNLGPSAGVNDFSDARYNFDKSGFPADRMIWEAVIALPKFRGDRLVELALHPITLGFGKSRWVRGRPMFAEGELAAKILGDITKFSADMGTKITVRNGIGYVDLASQSSQ
jgi:capsule synthesis protein PGA_cap